ncbi:MAG: hypothetical protein HY581_08050 [Nitrospirae bacterium]|nr:hypothetical protein [Nitrospirota bacterium]
MSGPFSLRYLHLFVKKGLAGAFILSKNGASADFVGASPDDLAAAIERVGRPSGYRYFWFAYAASAEQAHELERIWYHRYHPSDNPSPPSHGHGAGWACTIPGCAACALAQSKR